MDASFEVPDPVFRFTFDDSPSVGLLRDVGTACLDCGTVIAKANPVHLQKCGGEMDEGWRQKASIATGLSR